MNEISEKKITHRITSKLQQRSPVRISLPKSGMLNIDRPVPFLLVYRFPPDGKDYFTYELGKTESSYIMAHDDKDSLLQPVLKTLIQEMSESFGAFLLLEVWVADHTKTSDFTILINHRSAEPVAEILKNELSISIGRSHISTEVEMTEAIAPPYHTPLLARQEAKKLGCQLIGLEIKPIYINSLTGKPYPLFLRELRSAFGKALKKAFFEFIRLHTSFNASNFEMLGTTTIEELVWEIDAKLAEYSNQFDFLFLITPVNVEKAWQEFEKSNFQKAPVFHYRHMPIDPEIIKRKIYDLPIEEIADPTIAFLFRDKRKETDRMLTMMIDREKPDFVQSSIQVFGRIDEHLLEVANGLLVAIPTPANKQERQRDMMELDEFMALAQHELDYLKEQYEGVDCRIKVRDDMEGILVSRGVLCINKKFRVERSRATALIQHEIGTHVATYYNGMAQPFRLFFCGVPGYEQLQEGLAVLSEFIVGGLTNTRLRTLAARVVAVHRMVSGYSFVDTFYLLVDKYEFTPEAAFLITMRVYRGGGLTKDAVYLKGLLNLLEYIREGKNIMPLLIGKIRQDYLPILEELVHRKLLKPIPIKPRYLEDQYSDQLKKLEKGISVFNMIQ